MGQRKLTQEELQDVENAVRYLRRVLNLGCHAVYASIVLDGLIAIAEYGTTDGRPWIEPQPEIGEGYRVATEADNQRQDRNRWDSRDSTWYYTEAGVYASDIIYRVPKDRIPTDEDAVGRPMVMVRDRIDGEAWQPAKLIEVDPFQCQEFYARVDSDQESFWWDECRFPYPGELP